MSQLQWRGGCLAINRGVKGRIDALLGQTFSYIYIDGYWEKLTFFYKSIFRRFNLVPEIYTELNQKEGKNLWKKRV